MFYLKGKVKKKYGSLKMTELNIYINYKGINKT